MDNKKWSKRFSTIFWWVLAFLPLFTALIAYIGYYFAHLNGITAINDISLYFNDIDRHFTHFLDYQFEGDLTFLEFTPDWLIDMFQSLFDSILGLQLPDYPTAWLNTFAWATWIFILHVIFDIIIWLPCFLHDLIDRFKK